MKNATEYGKRLKRLLPALKKKYPPGEGDNCVEALEALLLAVLRANSSASAARAALKALREEFVDYNEMRVAPAKDIVELLPTTTIEARAKAERLTQALERIFEHGKALSLDYAKALGKRELKTHLREDLRLDDFAEAYLTMTVFGGSAIPVDSRMVERLKEDEAVGPDATVEDTRTLLERTVPARDMAGVFDTLCAYADDVRPAKPTAAKPSKAKTAKKAQPSKTAKKPKAAKTKKARN